MDYKIIPLSKNLFFIRWYTSPDIGSESENQFLEDIKATLDEAEQPIYFISDLRKGRISNIEILRRLGKLAKHEHWGGSTAFSQDPLTSMFVGIFARFSKRAQQKDEIWESPQDAIAYLETLKPHITEDIDWDTVLKGEG